MRIHKWFPKASLWRDRAAKRIDGQSPDLAVCFLILCSCVAYAAWRGQDVNWDQQNYHLYDPFALLHARGDRDAAPAGPQSFLNPLPYLLAYCLDRTLPPLAAGLLVAAAQSLGLMLAWAIAWRLTRRLWPALLATLAAVTGPMVLTEIGTSFVDLSLAMPCLASVLLLLAGRDKPARPLLCGALTGAVIAMKPTSLFLLPPLLVLGAMLQPDMRKAAKAAALILAGSVVGGLISDGAWALHLWRAYRSPMFPFMNTLFHAPAAARVNFSDPRYHFEGWRHALGIPFGLAAGSDASGETVTQDGRLAFAGCLAALRLARLALRSHRKHGLDQFDALSAALLIGIAGWLVLCPIERYAVVLEILGGLLAVLLLAGLRPRLLADAAMLLATLLLVLTTRTADDFHRPWSQAVPLRVPSAIQAGATYGLLTHPLAVWVTTPPRPAYSFELSSTLLQPGGVLQIRTDRMLRESRDRLWLLNYDEPVADEVRQEMRIHGVVLAPPCARAASLFWIDTVFCRGVLTGPRRLGASDLAIGATARFSGKGDGLIYEISGFGTTDLDATWGVGHESALAFHLDPKTRASGAMLSIRLAGMVGAPARQVTITVDDAEPRTVRLGAPFYFAVPSICIRPHPGGDGTILVRFSAGALQSPAQLHLGIDPRLLSFKLYDMSLLRIGADKCGVDGREPR